MNSTLRGLAAALMLTGSALAQPAAAPADPPGMSEGDRAVLNRTTQDIVAVKPGLYMVVGAGGNVAVRVTPAGVILVDDKNPGDAIYADLLAKIASVTEQPVKVVINTHSHGDHTGNNGRFIAAGASVIAYNSPASRMAAQRPGGEIPAAANVVMTEPTRKVSLGGVDAVAVHLGDAHTDTDVVVFFPDLKTVATGDAYVAITPGVMYGDGGRLSGAQASMAKLLTYDFDTVIPGHGLTPVPRAQIVAFKGEIDRLIDRARAAIRDGATAETLMSKIDGSGFSWDLSARMWSNPAMSARIYEELTAKP